MDLGGSSRIHRAQIRIAAHLDFLEMPLLIERRVHVVAAQHVLLLLGRYAAGKRKFHRLLLEQRVRGMNGYRPRARRRQLLIWIPYGFGSNDNLDVVTQLKFLILRFNNGASGMAGYILATESYERISLSDLAGLVIDHRLGIYLQRVSCFNLDAAEKRDEAVLLIVNCAVRGDLVRLVSNGGVDS